MMVVAAFFTATAALSVILLKMVSRSRFLSENLWFFGFLGHWCDSFPGSFPLPSHWCQFPEGAAGILPGRPHESHLPDRSRQCSHLGRPKLSAEALEPGSTTEIPNLFPHCPSGPHRTQSPATLPNAALLHLLWSWISIWFRFGLQRHYFCFYFFVLKQKV